VTSNAQFLYTQPNGTPTGVFSSANNSIHEYVAQGNAHEVLNLAGGQIHDLRRTRAAEAAARARLEIAGAGLVVTVAQTFYGLAVAQRKFATAQRAFANRTLPQNQSGSGRGGEVAHSDAIKAQIQFNDRQRGLQDARLAMENARLALAVILFTDFEQNFTLADDFGLAPELPSLQGGTRHGGQKQSGHGGGYGYPGGGQLRAVGST